MWLGCPRRRTSARLLPFRCPPTCGYLPLLSGRSSQWPVTHRAQPAVRWASPPPYSRASSVVGLLRFTAGAEFVRVDRHYEPPASETGACKPVQRDTQWKSARSGTLIGFRGVFRDRWSSLKRPIEARCSGLRLCTSPRRALFFFVPSYIPTDRLLVESSPDPARAPLFFFRKIHLYGKTKKSTHGHQNQKPYCTHFFEPGLI